MQLHVQEPFEEVTGISTGKNDLKATTAKMKLAKGRCAQSPLSWYPFSRLV